MKTKSSQFSGIFLSLLVTLSGVGLAKSQGVKPFPKSRVGLVSQSSQSQQSSPNLNQSQWELLMYLTSQGEPSLPYSQHEPTLKFESGRVGGTSGCNQYMGSYQIERGTLSIEGIASTLRACEFPGLSEQEQDYIKGLTEATSYELNGEQLSLQDAQGRIRLMLQKSRPASLTGNLWQLQEYNNGRGGLVSVLGETEITLRLDEEGNVAGFAGCNRYQGQWQGSEEKFQLGPVSSTKKFCNQPEGVMKQEKDYLATLENATSYEVEGETLRLKDLQGGQIAGFKATIFYKE
jgi:heat shock protein HslJ